MNSLDSFIFVIGGFVDTKVSARVIYYHIKGQAWFESSAAVPQLNTARAQHSSCSTHEHIYAFGGRGKDYNMVGSIERLSTRALAGPVAAPQALWELIVLPELAATCKPSSRTNVIACAMSANEILILGGENHDNFILGDGLIFDTRSFRVVSRPIVDIHVAMGSSQCMYYCTQRRKLVGVFTNVRWLSFSIEVADSTSPFKVLDFHDCGSH